MANNLRLKDDGLPDYKEFREAYKRHQILRDLDKKGKEKVKRSMFSMNLT